MDTVTRVQILLEYASISKSANTLLLFLSLPPLSLSHSYTHTYTYTNIYIYIYGYSYKTSTQYCHFVKPMFTMCILKYWFGFIFRCWENKLNSHMKSLTQKQQRLFNIIYICVKKWHSITLNIYYRVRKVLQLHFNLVKRKRFYSERMVSSRPSYDHNQL